MDIEKLFEEMVDTGFGDMVELVEGYSGKGMGEKTCLAIHLRDKFEHGYLLQEFPEMKEMRVDGFGLGLVFY